MTDSPGQFEQKDTVGSSQIFTGVVGVDPIQVPSSATGNIISEFLLVAGENLAKKLYFSFDGSSWGPGDGIGQNGHFGWSPKGGLKQVWLKGSAANTKYTVVMNFEDF